MTEEIKLRSNRKNLTGQKFGKLTVIKPVKTINDTSRWLCKCECGNEKVVATYRLLSGRVTTCGDCFNTINFYIPEILRLEQENKNLKDNNNHLQAIIDDGRAENKRFREENKELESQRDEARIAYNNLILDIVSDIPFEGEIGGERFISIKDRLHQMQKALASLEEIRGMLVKLKTNDEDDFTYEYNKIEDKINEVLNLS